MILSEHFITVCPNQWFKRPSLIVQAHDTNLRTTFMFNRNNQPWTKRSLHPRVRLPCALEDSVNAFCVSHWIDTFSCVLHRNASRVIPRWELWWQPRSLLRSPEVEDRDDRALRRYRMRGRPFPHYRVLSDPPRWLSKTEQSNLTSDQINPQVPIMPVLTPITMPCANDTFTPQGSYWAKQDMIAFQNCQTSGIAEQSPKCPTS